MDGLSPDLVERYQAEGILFPFRVLSAEEAAHFRDRYLQVEALMPARPKAVELAQFHAHFRWAYELATKPEILDRVESLLGPDILVWTTALFPKYPHDPAYISWHQDGTYWGLDSTQVATAWVALTDSSIDNGCMRVAPGTHRQSILPHVETYAENNLLTRGQEVAAEVREEDALDVVLQPGEMSLHHVNIIHGSNPNRSDRMRIGFAIRFTTPAVKAESGARTAMLVRGEDRFGHFDLEQPPEDRPLADALASQRKEAADLLAALRATEGHFARR